MADEQTPDDPSRHTLIVISDDGNVYKLTKNDWQTEEHVLKPGDPGLGVIRQLENFGTYLGFIPNIAAGIGINCVLVNLKAVLNNNPPTDE